MSKDALPPLAILQSAATAGVMDLEPAKAFQFLAEYVNSYVERGGPSTGKGWEQELCKG